MTAAGKARGIIFRGDMVRAILDGRKTQTRRVVKPTAKGCTVGVYSDSDRGPYECVNVGDDGDPIDSEPIRCPYGAPGDRLWVRETLDWGAEGRLFYAADGAPTHVPEGVTFGVTRAVCPPFLMPRWASRLTLVVEAVRVERLSAITDEDARAEGFAPVSVPVTAEQDDGSIVAKTMTATARNLYLAAFRAMHKLAAADDPWLWVVTFSKEPANG